MQNIDIPRFIKVYSSNVEKVKLSQQEGLEFLLKNLFSPSQTDELDIRRIAYMLATVKHECADTWRPIVEVGDRKYCAKYESNTSLGRRLGNIYPGDGYLYRGRGYVQLTGRDNYSKFNKRLPSHLATDILSFPDKVLSPQVSFYIMMVGCRNGLFTGVCLAKYINDNGTDYRNARRVINGLDRADLIASYAVGIEKVIRETVI